MQDELEALTKVLDTPTRPLAAIVGGAKVSTKLDLLGNLLSKVDVLVIGGGMANTFLHAQGIVIGKSLAEREMADAVKPGIATSTVAIDKVPADRAILDVGPATVADLEARLAGSKTLVWNG